MLYAVNLYCERSDTSKLYITKNVCDSTFFKANVTESSWFKQFTAPGWIFMLFRVD